MPEPTHVTEGTPPSRGRTLVAFNARSMDALAGGGSGRTTPR